MRRLGKLGSQVGNFFKGQSHSSGSSRGRTYEREEGSSRRARSPSPDLSNLRSRSSSAASSPAVSRSSSVTSSPVRSRPISTVASPTRFDERGRVTDPGHIQYQTSEYERARYPEMSEALGHSRYIGPGAPRAERFPVSGYLQDGRPFNVTGVRGPAINAGDDHVIDHRYASHVIDHGEMSDDQANRYIEYQSRPVFPTYETSGYYGSNCVHAHAYLGPGREPFRVERPTPPACNAGPTGRADGRLERQRLQLQQPQERQR